MKCSGFGMCQKVFMATTNGSFLVFYAILSRLLPYLWLIDLHCYLITAKHEKNDKKT